MIDGEFKWDTALGSAKLALRHVIGDSCWKWEADVFEDLCQDILVRVAKSVSKGNGVTRKQYCFYAIDALRSHTKRNRRNRLSTLPELVEFDESEHGKQEPSDPLDRIWFERCLEKLHKMPDTEAQLLACYVTGGGKKEAASILGCERSWAYRRMNAALQRAERLVRE